MSENANESAVKVSRYDLRRVRLAQALIPATLVSRIAAKYQPGLLTLAVGVALFVVTGFVVFTMRKGFGARQLTSSKGHVQFGSNQISVTETVSWSMSGSTAIVRTRTATWRLRGKPGTEQLLRTTVQRALGAPLELSRGGTRRARMVALLLTLVSAAGFGVGAYFSILPLVAIGVLGVISAGVIFAVLSAKIHTKAQQGDR